MINKLLADIKSYIEYLEENDIYVSVHTSFTEYMLPLLEFNIHKNPKCLLVKSDNDAWERCIKLHNSENSKQTGMKVRICHAGVEEAVFFLSFGGSVCISTAKETDNTRLCILVNPLCRMIEYLNLICPKPEIEITENELVNRAVKFINRNFYNNISNQDIADNCSCSVSSICHLFRKYKGVTIHQYINDLKLSYAKELLKTSNISITSVANKAGFSDYNYFAVRFKKETGIAP